MKKLFLYIVMMIFVCSLTGCGEDSRSELDQKELVYSYDSLVCMDQVKGEVKNFVAKGDYLYFCTGEYTENESMGEEMTESHFYKCRLDGSELTTLPIKWDLDNFEWLHSMEISANGDLWMLFSAYSEKRMANTYILRLVNESGTVEKELDINDLMDVEEFYVSDIKTDAADNLYINTGYSVIILNAGGEPLGVVEDDVLIENLIRAKDGSVWAGFGYDERYVLKPIRLSDMLFGDEYNTGLSFYEISLCEDGVVGDFCYRKGESLYSYDLATSISTELVSFIASGINTTSLGALQILSGETVLALYGMDDETDPYGLYLFKKKDSKDVKVKKIVTFASCYPDEEVKKQALLFNKSQDKYLVVVKDYQNYENPEKELYKDLLSGEVIDIVDFSGISSEKYMAQELFVDLYAFMKRDKEVTREDFSENLLHIMETEGKLYHISPTVGINAVFAKAADVEQKRPLTFEKVAAMEKDGAKAFYRETKVSMLSLMLEMNYESYMDWAAGTCNFEDAEFLAALEYANTYEDDSVDFWLEEEESATTKIRKGEILFQLKYMVSPADLQLYEEIFGEEIALIGFPAETYTGASMTMNRDFAICDASSDKKGAWEFLKTFLSNDYALKDTEDVLAVPLRSDSLEEKMERYESMSYEWGYEEAEIEVKPMNEKEKAIYLELIQNMDRKYVYDYDIMTIVTEEAEPYFEGNITAQDAAANIQKRVSVYMADYSKEE